MYTNNKSLPALRFLLVLVIPVGILINSCNKRDAVSVKTEGAIYMPQAFGTRSTLSLVLIDSPQQVVFGAAYGGLKYPSANINVNFKIDSPAVAVYNQVHGTSYVLLPASSYTDSALSSVIRAGKTSSDPLTLSIVTSKLNSSLIYMLPVTLTSVSAGTIDSSLRTSYFMINQLNNIYAGSYHTTGTRTNYNADGTNAGVSTISDTRVLTTMSSDSCSINTIANLGAYNGTVFYVRVNHDNTLEFSGYLQNDPGSPIGNQPSTTSNYDPVAKTFTVHYMYTNTNGTYRYMDEVWTPQ
jgi:uncharacterized protein DUF1735/uncharacterized protein DUF4361